MEGLRHRLTLESVRRLRHIINVFLRHGFGEVIDRIRLGRFIALRARLKSFGAWEPFERQAFSERLVMAFAELGPTFIKLAQFLSSRPDLVTFEVAEEFRKLQDEVPPFPGGEALAIIESETGRDGKEIFATFDENPLAAASIAQVHAAALLDGSNVVVKVQRPGIRADIEADIALLFHIAERLERHLPESRIFNPVGLVSEFSRTIREELDFRRESQNINRFRTLLNDTPGIHSPRVFDQFVTGRVIVMERIDGVRIDDVKALDSRGIDRQHLAGMLIDVYLRQILDHGFFHADPHPGNLLVTGDGGIAFLDFGIMGTVSEDLKVAIADIFVAVVTKDFDRLIEEYAEIGIIPDHAYTADFRKTFKRELRDLMVPLYDRPLGEIRFKEYLLAITGIALKYQLKLPPDLILINKTLLLLENIARQLDPDANIIAAAEPYASVIAAREAGFSALGRKAWKSLLDLGEAAVDAPVLLRQMMRKALKDNALIRVDHVNLPEFAKDLDRASNRIAFALIVSAMILSSAVMHAASVLPTVYGVSFLGLTAFFVAVILGIWLIISIIRSGRL